VLDLVTAIRFDGRVQTGRTMPCRLACETAAGGQVEVVAKLSGGCERRVAALVSEAIAAMLAADLGLPVPEPFLVRLDPEFVETIPDRTVTEIAQRSNPVAFGSKSLPPGYTSWPVGKSIPKDALNLAAEIFAFDALIANADRRPENPNCLFSGSSLAILDHELAFVIEGVIGWQPPWEVGALEAMRRSSKHLFSEQLRGKTLNFDRLSGAWATITDARLTVYRGALPREWNEAREIADKALTYVASVRDNLTTALQEIERVLR
jgi:HipA-like kinase